MDNLERDDLYTGLTEEMLNPGNSREYSMDKDMMARYLRYQDAVEKGWCEWQKLDTLKREDITEYCGVYEIATTKPFLRLKGTTTILYIGKSLDAANGLRSRLSGFTTPSGRPALKVANQCYLSLYIIGFCHFQTHFGTDLDGL